MKETGSLFNLLMGNNNTLPEVGKGATILLWSDRHAYEVISVSEDKKEVVIQRYDPERIDGLGMSDCQTYKYEKLTEEKRTVVWRNNAWRTKVTEIHYTKDFLKSRNLIGAISYAKHLTPDEYAKVYDNGKASFPVLVEGITEKRFKFPKVNIIWGHLDEHYDFSF